MTLSKCRIYWVIECDFAKSSVNDTFHDTSNDRLLQDITLTFIDICENWGTILLACSSDFELQKLTYFFHYVMPHKIVKTLSLEIQK